MTVKLPIDVNLSPKWVPVLGELGWPAVHWSDIDDPRANDDAIMAWAKDDHPVDIEAAGRRWHPKLQRPWNTASRRSTKDRMPSRASAEFTVRSRMAGISLNAARSPRSR